MNRKTYYELRARVIDAGYRREIEWAEKLEPVKDSWSFFTEYVWVVLNAGMKEQVARKIFERVMMEFRGGRVGIQKVFGHRGKCEAIIRTLGGLKKTFAEFKALDDDESRIEFLETLPFIGPVTKYHLAKNYGVTSVAKPDRHLVRIARGFKLNAQQLCEKVSRLTGDTVAVVDLVIWRGANLGFI